jgi:hypothetical protein
MNIPVRIVRQKRPDSERLEFWVNVYPYGLNNTIHNSLADAERAVGDHRIRVAHLVEADDTMPKREYRKIKPGDYYVVLSTGIVYRRDEDYSYSVALDDNSIRPTYNYETDDIRLATVEFRDGEIVATVED